MKRRPQPMAWLMTSAGTVFVAARNVMSSGFLPERTAASAMRFVMTL